MTLDIYALGKRVRTVRKQIGLSQSELSEIIDKSPTYLSYLENGTKTMSLDTFVDLVNALKVTADELLQDSLEGNNLPSGRIIAALVADCNQYEQGVLMDLIGSVKKSLRSNAGQYPFDLQ